MDQNLSTIKRKPNENVTIPKKRVNVGKYFDLFGPLLGIALFTIFMIIMAPQFVAGHNVINILHQASIYIILAVGMTFVITGGGIDVSIGSVLALTGVTMSYVVKFTTLPPFFGLLTALVVGGICGIINGVLVVKLKLPEFITTIATMMGFRGVVLVLSGGLTFYGYPQTIKFLGGSKLFGFLPLAIVISVIVVLIGNYAYHNTKFGRYTIAMGGNKEATILSGINVNKYKIYNFAVMGVLAGLAGIMTVGRLDSFNSNLGTATEMDVIAAVIIGGTALSGGRGKIWSSAFGAILLAMVMNGVVVLGLPYFYQYIAVTVVIIMAVSMYTVNKTRD